MKSTIEYIGEWETLYNPNFNSPEFGGIKNEAGLNRFILSVKQWVEKTNSKGIIAKAGSWGKIIQIIITVLSAIAGLVTGTAVAAN